MKSKQENDEKFTLFHQDISHITLPVKLNFPFCYKPHELAVIASHQLQQYILTQSEICEAIGLNENSGGPGKMFGVLVVKNIDSKIGYLSAFSGKIGSKNQYPRFVPPIFDNLEETGFYKSGEEEVNIINRNLNALTNKAEYRDLLERLEDVKLKSESEIDKLKSEFIVAKKKRRNMRLEYNESHGKSSENAFLDLDNESKRHHFIFKDCKKYYKNKVENLMSQLEPYQKAIIELRGKRKVMSAKLQQQLFESYSFLNILGISSNISEIFQVNEDQIPPAGAGECVAPKLLQYAFKTSLVPLALAEFWWGKSPTSEVRKHGMFYPACNSKCKPILGHMLEGLEVDENPMAENNSQFSDLDILYEDNYLVLVNKPCGMLSVPGKTKRNSVYDITRKKYPEATGPLIVHRLDMSTSGIMLIAKSKEIHKQLQTQFIKRNIKKRYVAILEGLVSQNEGEIHLPLRVDLDDRPRQLVCYKHGKTAITQWTVEERKNGVTRIYFYPVTGRTHQLRVHASHHMGLDMPIKGDDLYGVRSDRLYLHAEKLEFTHPVTNEKISIECKANF